VALVGEDAPPPSCPGWGAAGGCGATWQTHRSQKPVDEGSNPSIRTYRVPVDFLEIAVRHRDAEHAGESPCEEAVIQVNGADLIELVRPMEQPFADAEGSSQIAGAYVGIPAGTAFLPSRHLLGAPDDLFSDLVRSGKVSKAALLMCECGEPGCWPFCARIEITGDVVRWSDFEQPHRTGNGERPEWRYDGLGPFTFARNQYEAALQRPITPP
jgi:hypothetical protein